MSAHDPLPMRYRAKRHISCAVALDLAVFGLLVVTAQEVGDRPDEGGEGLAVHCSSGVAWCDGASRKWLSYAEAGAGDRCWLHRGGGGARLRS